MDFGALGSMSGRSSMRRKSLLQALGKSSSRQSAIPVPVPVSYPYSHSHTASTSASTSAPASTYSTPQSHAVPIFSDDLYSPSPEYDNASISSTSRVPYSSTSSSAAGHPPVSYGQGGYGLHATQSHGHGHAHAYGGGQGQGHGHGGGRTVSNSSASKIDSAIVKDKDKDKGLVLRRPEDVFRVVRERMLSWSYMMEWYQGDTHWFNTVRIPRALVESSLGPVKLDSRSRNFYALGISLSALFDIPSASDFLRALMKLLDEWEGWAEGAGGKGVKNLFRGPRSGRKPGTGSMMSDFTASLDGSESYLLNINVPFTPDFFQVHSSTCSIIRDIYKKILGMFLPSPSTSSSSSIPIPNRSNPSLISLSHASTIISSAPLDKPFPGAGGGSVNPRSPPSTSSGSTFQGMGLTSPSSTLVGTEPSGSASAFPTYHGQGQGHGHGYDALQALIAGELPNDRTLVGDGQKLTAQNIELFLKVDAKLKKHFSTLLREGDALARRVLDDEMAALLSSLVPGATPMRFDYNAATIGAAGWAGTGSGGGGLGAGGPGGLGGTVWESEETRRDVGTV